MKIRLSMERALTASTMILLVATAILIAIMTTLGGCATPVGPGASSRGDAAEVTFGAGSTTSLGASGDWSAASPQPFAVSGGYITDDQLSSLMAESFGGQRLTSHSWGFMTGGSWSVEGLSVEFQANEFSGRNEITSFSADSMSRDAEPFFGAVEAFAPLVADVAKSLGPQATQQFIEQVRARRDAVQGFQRLALDALLEQFGASPTGGE